MLQRNPNDYKLSHITIAMNGYDMDREIAEIAIALKSTTDKAVQDDAFNCNTSFQQDQFTLDVYKLCMDCSSDSVNLSRSACIFINGYYRLQELQLSVHHLSSFYGYVFDLL